MSHFVTLNRHYHNRYIFELLVCKREFSCIVDTACSTTLMPLPMAKRYGMPTQHKQKVIVGGRGYTSTLYIIKNVKIGDYSIGKLSVFASNYEGVLKEYILIGQNVLNSMKFTLSRNASRMQFEIDIWDIVKHKRHPFALFFDNRGSRPVYDENLLVEFEEI